ncbi:MAG: hypothetical protein AMXMBFR33_38590 [Candidatus Xenobia bacterium]|jgi:asparaginyl-tRNA synthetase
MSIDTTTVPVTTIEQIGQYAGQKVRLRGWLDNMRSSGKIRFLKLRDGTGRIQGVLTKNDAGEELFERTGHLGQESSLIVEGEVREDARAPGGYELLVSGVEIVQNAEGYPITPKDHGTDFLMDHRHLWIRSQRQHAILRVRAQVMRSISDWLDNHGFLRIDTPILTPSACEGTTTLFETKYFENSAFLSQSGQLYNEATAMAFGKVYAFGPTFRAEKSKTRRHLMEFWMVEPEMAFVDMWENMEIQEQMVSYVVQQCLQHRRRELELLERDFSKLEKIVPPFPRIHYDEAVQILRDKGVEFEWGGDFGGTDETLVSEQFDRPVFVHHFPAAVKAFYMKPDPDRPETVLGADLLAPEGYGEVIGGGQRLDDLALLEQRIAEHQLPPEAYAWYVDLRRYGSVPHSGFGLGVERTVTWICGIEHVRETIAFPRTLYRLYP